MGSLNGNQTSTGGAFFLSLSDGMDEHFFIFQPVTQTLQRITTQPGEDRDPALSPDGKQIAFSSRRNGYWDLYILDLSSGKTQRVTDTPEYEGAPAWSPDGQWLAYEVYNGDNLDIFLRPLANPTDAPVQLTDDPAPDFAPSWSPEGRTIAFVSGRSGEDEIWMASLDRIEDRFQNLSLSADTSESHPAWSPDGRYLAWAVEALGSRSIVVWDSQGTTGSTTPLGLGRSTCLECRWQRINGTPLQSEPGSDYNLSISRWRSRNVLYPFAGQFPWFSLAAWSDSRFTNRLLPSRTIHHHFARPVVACPHHFAGNTRRKGGAGSLTGCHRAVCFFADSLDESFNALRSDLSNQAGWDVLLNLENAYYPLTEPSSPGVIEDWLYTGRAFALNPLPFSAGWLISVREDFNGQTYWRLYARTRYQDGSQGSPLSVHPWNLDARHSGDTQAYEHGGTLAPIPAGYWLDLTDLAARYGWQRLPALTNWRSYYAASRFNQFVMRDGLSWKEAMAQLYPEEAIVTPTFVPTPTITMTPTRTLIPGRRYYQTSTPTVTPVTPTATNRPTWTPPAATPTP